MLLPESPIIWIIIVSLLTYLPTILPSQMGMEIRVHFSGFPHLSSPSPLLKNYSRGKLKKKAKRTTKSQLSATLAVRNLPVNNVLPADSRAEDGRLPLLLASSSPPTRGEGAEAIKRK